MPSPDPSAPSYTTTSAPSLADSIQYPTVHNGGPTYSPSQAANTPRSTAADDAIQQAKEKARATVSASLQPGPLSIPPSRAVTKSPSIIQTGSQHATPPSRKRSRSGTRIDRSDETDLPNLNRLLIDQYMARDQIHAQALQRDKERYMQLATEMSQEKVIWEEFRRRSQIEAGRRPTQTLYPAQRRRPAGRKTATLRISTKDRANQADQLEDLVPVRLDLEHEKLRLRDTFTWNIHDRVVRPEVFAQGLVEDFKIPPEASDYFTREVYRAMQEQIGDFHPHVFLEEEPLDPHLPYSAYKNDEMRVSIKLNITIGNHTLVDQFDWDINDINNCPESFAQHMASDLALSGEFMTAIAHCIREQTQLFTKGLYVAAHQFDGRPIEDPEIRDCILPSPMHSAFRPFQAAKDYAPYFYELNDADLERTELAFSREQRQQKRSTNRRGGPSLPDLKERLKTWRTLVISTVIPGAADAVDKSGIYRVSRARRKPWNAGARGGDEEDDVLLSAESGEDSDIESPVRAQNAFGGTSRTRGMRGAASAAQAAMRANFARSQSPDSQFVETRVMSRRLGAGPLYESIDENGMREGLTVKLKVPRERFRQWWREWKRMLPAREAEMARVKAAQQQSLFAPHQAGQIAQHQHQQQYARIGAGGHGGPGNMGPPPSTPGLHQRPLPGGMVGPGASYSRPPSADPRFHDGMLMATPTPPPFGMGPTG